MDRPLTQRRSRRVRYRLIDKDGNEVARGDSAHNLAIIASQLWPDQDQDDERTGKGWDLSVVGVGR